MGMFDSFMGYWRCPDCGKSGEIEVQTKQLDNMLTYYHTGMRVNNIDNPSMQGNYIIKEWVWCPSCSHELGEEENGLRWHKLKDKWREHEVNIVIENDIYKEMVFTGRTKDIDVSAQRLELWPEDGGN